MNALLLAGVRLPVRRTEYVLDMSSWFSASSILSIFILEPFLGLADDGPQAV
jgi:hypothetical protein